MNKHEIILSIRELLERNLDIAEISHRLHLDVETVRAIAEALQNYLA